MTPPATVDSTLTASETRRSVRSSCAPRNRRWDQPYANSSVTSISASYRSATRRSRARPGDRDTGAPIEARGALAELTDANGHYASSNIGLGENNSPIETSLQSSKSDTELKRVRDVRLHQSPTSTSRSCLKPRASTIVVEDTRSKQSHVVVPELLRSRITWPARTERRLTSPRPRTFVRGPVPRSRTLHSALAERVPTRCLLASRSTTPSPIPIGEVRRRHPCDDRLVRACTPDQRPGTYAIPICRPPPKSRSHA